MIYLPHPPPTPILLYTPACKKDDTQALQPGVQGEFMPSEELIKYFERCRGGGGRKYDSIPWVYGPSEDRASVSVWVLFWYEHCYCTQFWSVSSRESSIFLKEIVFGEHGC